VASESEGRGVNTGKVTAAQVKKRAGLETLPKNHQALGGVAAEVSSMQAHLSAYFCRLSCYRPMICTALHKGKEATLDSDHMKKANKVI
jgi:hypothetical protein